MRMILIGIGIFVVGLIACVSSAMIVGHENNIVFKIFMPVTAIGFFGTLILLIRKLFKFIGSLIGGSGKSSIDTKAWAESRKNDPHTCGNCTKFLNKGVCRLTGEHTPATDTCNNWC